MSGTALLISLPVALVGAWYLVNAGNVAPLGALEGDRANQARVRLRRANGAVMIVMGAALYLAVSRSFPLRPAGRMGLVAPLAWIATLPLLLTMLVLAVLDVRLTRRLRRELVRKAAMKSTRDRGELSPEAPSTVRGLALATAVLLTAGSGIACDDATAQRSAAGTGATTRPAVTSPAAAQDRPTARAADVRGLGPEEPQQLRTIEMTLGERTFVLQVADTHDERQAGLMFRPSMPAGAGMLFVFPDEAHRSFWMKNTFIPLDIIYVSADGVVVNIVPMAARDLRGHESAGPAKWAIELNLGMAAKAGVKPGMKVQIPENARVALD